MLSLARTEPALQDCNQRSSMLLLGWLSWPWLCHSPKRESVIVLNHTVLSSTVFQSGDEELSGCASRRMASPQLASV